MVYNEFRIKYGLDAVFGERSNQEQQTRPLATRSTSSSTIPIDKSKRIAQEQISKTEEVRYSIVFVVYNYDI